MPSYNTFLYDYCDIGKHYVVNNSYRIAFFSAVFCNTHCPLCKTVKLERRQLIVMKSIAQAAIYNLL